ncbi:hypothetical protein GTV15_04355, partial [Streptomyces sp. SID7803]|nr:hypothetical protein [Streptomyces sp. SID7803]
MPRYGLPGGARVIGLLGGGCIIAGSSRRGGPTMAGHICPECGTESRPGTAPGCA